MLRALKSLILLPVLFLGATGLVNAQSTVLSLPTDYASIELIRATPPGTGHGLACPVGVGAMAFTAAHVMEHDPEVWVDPLDSSNHGVPRKAQDYPNLDLTKIIAVGEGTVLFPHPRPIAKHAPKTGEALVIYGFFNEAPTVFYGTAVALNADGLLMVDATSWPGSSGGCVCSLKTGEIYAIVNGASLSDIESLGLERPMLRATPIWGKK